MLTKKNTSDLNNIGSIENTIRSREPTILEEAQASYYKNDRIGDTDTMKQTKMTWI